MTCSIYQMAQPLISGDIMYVSPIDHETYFPLGMREVAVVDSSNHIVFLRIFAKLAERHREQRLVGERHASFVMATSMEVDQDSKNLLSTAETTLTFHRCLACHQFDMLEGVHEQIHNDLSYRNAVKNVVLIRRDAHKPANEYNDVQLHAQASSVKHIFNYLMHSTPVTPSADVINNQSLPDQVNKMDQLD